MTVITTSEIKILIIQFILMAILGAFMNLYVSDPIVSNNNVPTDAINQSTEISSQGSWINNIISIPEKMGVLFWISALIISPFLIFDSIIALRFAKDIATGWV